MGDMLVTDLNKLCDELPFHTGWYLKHLHTGETAHRHGHVVVPSASTRKIAIMMAALKAVHEGKLALEQPVTMQAKYWLDGVIPLAMARVSRDGEALQLLLRALSTGWGGVRVKLRPDRQGSRASKPRLWPSQFITYVIRKNLIARTRRFLPRTCQ